MADAGRQQGFTLIELLITILIIGILAAVGLAAYNGQRERAHTAESWSAIRTAHTAARSFYLEHGDSYTGATHAALREYENSISSYSCNWALQAGPDRNPSCIARNESIWCSGCVNGTGESIALCSTSRGRRAYCLVDNPRGRVQYCGWSDLDDNPASVGGHTPASANAALADAVARKRPCWH